MDLNSDSIVNSIPPTDFTPLNKPKTYIPEKPYEKKKHLDELYSNDWLKNYFGSKGRPLTNPLSEGT
jgi:hypothetical protein